MRLSFGNGEHADLVVDNGTVTFGNANGNTVVLPGRDVVAWHARLILDRRGAVLEVLDPAAQTHVNARPVREKALLRHGDLLCLGSVTIALKADRDDLIHTTIPEPAPLSASTPIQPSRTTLRGVSGSHFGKTISINRRLLIGRGKDCGLVIDEARIAPHHALLENVGNAIYLRDIDSPDGMDVNGIRVRNAIVHAGDQLAFERNQFIIEAPALPPRGEDSVRAAHAITETLSAVPGGNARESQRRQGRGATGWLIGVAVLIALGFALLLHRGI
jgi:pSer/pThr/pTyr-binding forkhead associated (FHA) protein